MHITAQLVNLPQIVSANLGGETMSKYPLEMHHLAIYLHWELFLLREAPKKVNPLMALLGGGGRP